VNRSWVQLALLAGLIIIAAYVADKQRTAPELQTLQTSLAGKPTQDNAQQGFDFYVLALSWSPSYCEIKGSEADAEQCGGKPLGFTVHGLWPQYERGFPENCSIGQSGGVSRDILRKIDAVLPADGLARHQWRKHGTCSGLTQQAYFLTLSDAFSRIIIPDEYRRADQARTVSPKRVEANFRAVNPGIPADGFAPVCNDGYLTEVRICMTKELAFRACAQVDRNSCRAGNVKLPPMN
jgi:ribonuclease T2